ncbi:MAG: hypothetical protein ACWGHH_05675 [Sulfurovaceae bacterium]
MFAIFNYIFSFLGGVGAWLVQKGLSRGIAFGLLKGFSVAANALFLAALYFGISFITNIYNIFIDFVSGYNTYSASVIVGKNDIVQLFFGFMDASGIGLAFTTTMNLLFTVILLKLTWILYVIYSKYAFTAYTMYADFIKSLFK